MDQITENVKKLNQLKEELSKQFLEESTRTTLENKLVEVNNAAQVVISVWDTTNLDDVPDDAASTWDSKKTDTIAIRDELRGKLEAALIPKRAADANLGLAGAQAVQEQGTPQPEASVSEQIESLNKIHELLLKELKDVTDEYIKANTKEILQAKRDTITTYHNNWQEIFKSIDKTKLTPAQASKLKRQRTDMLKQFDDRDDELAKRILIEKLEESRIWIEEHMAKHKETDRSAEEAKEEKALKEQAIKEKEEKHRLLIEAEAAKTDALNQIKELQRQLDEAKNQPTTSTHQKRLDDAIRAKEKAERERDDAEAIKHVEIRKRREAEQAKATAENNLQELTDKFKDDVNHLKDAILQVKTEAAQGTKDAVKQLQKAMKDGERAIRNDSDSEEMPVGAPLNNENVPIMTGAPRKKEPVITLKIDTVTLPTFGGDLTEWVSFRDFFEYLIHNNSQFSDTMKFHQLRTHLRGTALDTIRGYQLSGENYAAAWGDLKKRFDRKEDLVQEYIRRFLEIPAIVGRPTFNKLRAIVDGTNQMRRALPTLDVDVYGWDPWICLIIMTKLDEATRQEWKQRVGRQETTNVTTLLDFIETRAVEIQPAQGDRLVQMLRGADANRRGPRRIFQIAPEKRVFQATPEPNKLKTQDKSTKMNSPLVCPLCKGSHRIWHCDKLKAQCAKVRTETIKSLKMCFKCLLKHQLGDCNHDDCPYCSGPHHILLCYKKENDDKRRQESQKAGPSTNFRQRPKKKEIRPETGAIPKKKEGRPPSPNDDWSDWEEVEPKL